MSRKPLSDKQIQQLKPQKTNKYYSVGGAEGLLIQVTPNGTKSWVLRYNIKSEDVEWQKRRHYGLGRYPAVSLKDARLQAVNLKEKIRNGFDPQQEKELAKIAPATGVSFEKAARQWLELKAKEWKAKKDFPQNTKRLEKHVFPKLGSIDLDQIQSTHIITILEPIWLEIPTSAERILGYIRNIFDYAIVKGYAQGPNPTPNKAQMVMVLGNTSKYKQGRFAALPFNDIGRFLRHLRKKTSPSARCLEFAILTAARSKEARTATWDDIDFEQRIWTKPDTKTNKEHRVPLTDAMIDLLKSLPRIEGSNLVFPSPRGKVLSDVAVEKIIRGMHDAEVKAGRKGYVDPKQLDTDGNPKIVTPHGTARSSFRDWAAETTDYPNEVIEMALGHTIKNKAEAAYRRGDMLEKRRPLMADWNAYCLPKK